MSEIKITGKVYESVTDMLLDQLADKDAEIERLKTEVERTKELMLFAHENKIREKDAEIEKLTQEVIRLRQHEVDANYWRQSGQEAAGEIERLKADYEHRIEILENRITGQSQLLTRAAEALEVELPGCLQDGGEHELCKLIKELREAVK